MHPKDADVMANSVDPDLTASSVWSWSALFAETYLSQYIEFVRYSSVSGEIKSHLKSNIHTTSFYMKFYNTCRMVVSFHMK